MRGLVHGTMHLSIGQEARAVGACMGLREGDCITSTHRRPGHCMARGADVDRMFAEFFGKEAGYCKGRGGSMHIADVEKGYLGVDGIVGGGLPIAVGSALAASRLGTGAVAVCFFGDGANNEGAFHESLNMAVLWILPVAFVCENNQYGMSTSVSRSTSAGSIVVRAAVYAMPGYSVEGNDFSAVAEAVDPAIARARRGKGSSLIECRTYRWREQSRSDRNRYRSREEIDAWMEQDPIPRMARMLVEHGFLTAQEVAGIGADVEREIAEAVEFARNAPDPNPRELTRDVDTRVTA